jgi:hypothetical protein
MRKKLMNGLSLLALQLVSSFALAAHSDHLEKLRSRFPHGLLGDDYGILAMDDLARNACDVKPRPFPPGSSYYPYEYWQCFESKSVSFDCDSSGIPDPYEGVMGLVVVKASSRRIQHEYIEHRLWPIKECKGFIRDAANLLKGTRYACISGSFIENETGRSGLLTSSWLFERIKTKKGCEGRGCDFSQKFKQDNCPDSKS